MNETLRKQKEKELREEMKALGYGWINGSYNRPPEELGFTKRLSEFSCISMIDSILCYSCKGWQDAEAVMQYEENHPYNYLADYVAVLGRERVIELIQGQIDDIDYIEEDTLIDNEGIHYSSIVWKPDIEELCPFCDHLSLIVWDGKSHTTECENCGKTIRLCSLCDCDVVDCENCKIESEE